MTMWDWRIGWRILFLLGTLTLIAYLAVKASWLYLLLVIPVVLYQLYDHYAYYHKALEELDQYVEAVRYRDFTRQFDEKHAPVDLRSFRKGFNQINTTFKQLARERETQWQYLQKIMEMINTGILSYAVTSGDVVWFNEAAKHLLQIPYLKNIHLLQKRDSQLYQDITTAKPGQSKMIQVQQEPHKLNYLLSTSIIQVGDEKLHLVVLQNIHGATEETESRAWQKLLNVMTHEIMNSIAPITSLADTLKRQLHEAKISPQFNQEDLETGMDIIKRRSEGLLRFAETYRNLNKIAQPNLQKFYVRNLLDNVVLLMSPSLQHKHIQLSVQLANPEYQLDADSNLLEQVLINLILNAKEALAGRENPEIKLIASTNNEQKIQLKIADNGIGIEPEIIDNIFVPFFTTRKSGSGIGLSLCKQIMALHKGNIQVHSAVGKGTVFTLTFP